MWFQLKFRRSGIANQVIHSWRATEIAWSFWSWAGRRNSVKSHPCRKKHPKLGCGGGKFGLCWNFALQIGKGTSLPKVLILHWGCGLCEQCHELLPDHFCRNNYDGVRLYSFLPLPHQYTSTALLSATAHAAKLRKEKQKGWSFLKDQC